MSKRKSKPEIALQHDQSDCGAACLFSVIQYHEGDESLENIKRIAGTNSSGTTLLGLCKAAEILGFDAEGYEGNLHSLIEHPDPCILHVTLANNYNHFIVFYGQNNNAGDIKFIIGDPAKGMDLLSENELAKIWVSKFCLLLKPNATFRKKSAVNKEKIKWVKGLLKADLPVLIIAAVIGMAIAALGLVMAIYSQKLIDEILPKKEFQKLYTGIVLVFLLLLAKEWLTAIRQVFLMNQSKQLSLRITEYFYNHLLRLPKPFFDARKIGELTARLTDTSRIQRVISQLAGNAIIDILVTAVTLGFLFYFSWSVAFICLFVLPIYFLIIRRFNLHILKGQRNIMSAYATCEANYISTLQGVEIIKNYNKVELFGNINIALYRKYQDTILNFGRFQIRLSFITNSLSVLFLSAILLFTSHKVLSNQLKIGEMMAILSMCASLLPGVANFALMSIPINEAKIAFDRMFEFTSIEQEVDMGANIPVFSFNSMEVNQLSFRFPGRKQLLKNISFRVTTGEIIAIMGENGVGKTTLTSILQMHYRADTGTITINQNNDLQMIPTGIWRKIVGLIPQTIHFFNGTVLENIAFEDGTEKIKEVMEFLNEFGFTPFINNLPQGYNTLIGEEGINLSGGQKQIVALARALYHKPKLLILDEATASMDRDIEQFVQRLLTRLKKDMAIIFITHRLHILKKFCDRIYILKQGMITDSGSHTELLNRDNLYSQYWLELNA